MTLTYLYLAIAIAAEVIATSALTASGGFTKVVPTVIAMVGYGVAFYYLSVIVQSMPVGVVYAIWSGAGMTLLAIVSVVWFGHAFDLPAVMGIVLIVTGVVVINLFSSTVVH